MFCFWDKCIWLFCIHLSLLIREYLSEDVTVLRKGLKDFQVCKSDFCYSSTFRVITQDDKGTLIKIESAFRPVLPCRLSWDLLKQEFLDIYLSTSFVVGNFRNTKAMRVIFFWKCLQFNADYKNSKKNSEKVFCFLDKFMWILCIHLSLLIWEYLSSAVNALRKGVKNFHVSKSYFCYSITFTGIMQDDKGALIKTESVFRPVYHVACGGVLSNSSF